MKNFIQKLNKNENKNVGVVAHGDPKGITLISLVITIVVLIILAGVAINMTLGENGIFTKAQEAKKMQAIASAKEQIGLEILEAQIEAIDNNEELEQSQVETIVAKYGELQADGDTIILNDTEYEVSLRDIYNTMAEVETDGDSTTELAQLKALLAQTTVTEDKILKDYKAYKDGQLITGTMENYAGQTVEATTVTESGENAEITIPQAGYYDTTSKISIPVSEINSNLGEDMVLLWSNPTDTSEFWNKQANRTVTIDLEESYDAYILYTSQIYNNATVTNKTFVDTTGDTVWSYERSSDNSHLIFTKINDTQISIKCSGDPRCNTLRYVYGLK